MLSKVELELKKRPDHRKSSMDANGMKKGKIELGLKRPHRERDVNLIFTDSWQKYSECNGLPVRRRNEASKQMLVYRGKRSDGSTGSSDSSNSSHYDEQERAESTLSDFLSGSDHTIYEVDGESDADSPPHDPTHESALSPGSISSQQVPSCSSPKQYRYCWYCYETYKAMCLAQGKTPPGIYSRGLWRGHCMRDSNGVTTCPHLWFTTCTHCGATANSAHSPDFCPMLKFAGLAIHDQ